MSAFYESDRAVAEYLLFHYGTEEELLHSSGGPDDALEFPRRCAALLGPLPEGARALDLGCAVGRGAFELARLPHVAETVGVDYSRAFVAAAERMRKQGTLSLSVADEGELKRDLLVFRPADLDPARVRFVQGDAHAPDPAWGTFDAVLAANLLDRLADPARFLAALPALVRPGGQLLLTSPYTWSEEYTPRAKWLGGFVRDGVAIRTGAALAAALAPSFELISRTDLPFLIQEHARKFQWSVAEATLWRRV
jgi:putative 4-mercaptohistidine N1-methyltranferase